MEKPLDPSWKGKSYIAWVKRGGVYGGQVGAIVGFHIKNLLNSDKSDLVAGGKETIRSLHAIFNNKSIVEEITNDKGEVTERRRLDITHSLKQNPIIENIKPELQDIITHTFSITMKDWVENISSKWR